MQGTSLMKQERECKLYDEFDKFAYKKGETFRDFYLKFSLLLNDMNIYNVKLEQFQVNTKFLNTLPPEWSEFVTDVKLVQDLHTTNIDQLHAYLGQHEFHANEVRLMHERNSDPLALVATHQMTQSHYQSSTPISITYPFNDYQSSVHHKNYSPPLSIPQIEYSPTVTQQKQQYEFPQLDSCLTVPVFKQDDDPINAINHMMSFLSAVITSRFPTTNNQLRNSSNPRQQATINDGKVTVQPVQGGKFLLLRVMSSSEQSNVVNQSETEITSDSNIIPYSQYVIESQQNSMTSLDLTPPNKPTKVEVPKELPKVSMVNTSLNKLKHHLAGFDVLIKERTTATSITEAFGLLNNKTVHSDYLRLTQEQAAILREVVEQGKSQNPLNNSLDHAYSEHSSVTYTSVPSPVEDYSDIGSPEVDGPPSPDYVPGPEEPEQAPPSPVYLSYVPELVYPKYMPPEDDVFLAEEQPLPIAATPTTDSPGYIPEFDPKGDLKEDEDEDPEEDPADYPVDSTVVALPVVDHVPFEEVTKLLSQIPSPPLPIPSPPPDSPTHIKIPKSCLPLRKRLRFASPSPRANEELAPTTLQGVNQRVTDLSTVVEQETTIMYGMMEEAQDDRSQLRGQVNLLYRDRPVHHHLAIMIEREARMAREA
nr:hypothetical protein [Tanacetum cinerariifolium]